MSARGITRAGSGNFLFGRNTKGKVEWAEGHDAGQKEYHSQYSQDDSRYTADLTGKEEHPHDKGKHDADDTIDKTHVGFHKTSI